LRGGQGNIWAPDTFNLYGATDKPQFSDGLIVGTRTGANGTLRFAMPRIFEDKSGQPSTNELSLQPVRDVLRAKQGVGFALTDSQRRQLGLGLESTESYDIKKVGDGYDVFVNPGFIDEVDPRANPQLFHFGVPTGVALPENAKLPDNVLAVIKSNNLNFTSDGTLTALRLQLDEQHTTRLPYSAEQLQAFVNGWIQRVQKYGEEAAYFADAQQKLRTNAKIALGLVLAQNAGPALEEFNQLSNEKLVVNVKSSDDGGTTYVTVGMEINGQYRELKDSAQRTMLGYWYNQSVNLDSDQQLPAWLRGACTQTPPGNNR
jgi:hypothetical protein